ncbi:hypothetical protein EN858_17625 [Mesorhizobium sp. M4B.F.Ca.ET.215.01.1.1]|uniref:hypothetical protein n=1 Tax=unclassified Mesorhizobium TaxID=325217 RepID=UPI000FCBD717|nr:MULTISPECIES: hypothetical protein [unclassified Mesorhizobium]RUW72013.1 hypothetical protein EOA31_16580 [Mesorhizobium sp. M4B.F.Ca.ET.049.02.1.2]RVC78397.1 hypothetical protein EN745_19085 [Mesorhizobium sp. M4A.F.Ca.ET.022.05.2.1]TGQ10226.1 hypothetical protein EN858_17625 [Mesorhizobium sp. M4B.F.Ca.ET.215.01.1.1]TGQ34064.1 hypothetical protein EN863_033795 [Mesorhizobium sp. M00.F.Ca.ET.220.01.1.1]TGR02765.1 hypothetical protein EN846_17075 [Mesorhizobium sp. M4B.F.Ca.ET.203.01.1.1]
MVKPRENRVPIMMSEEEIAAIEEWRFANRINTRSDAIRRLCKIGLFISNELEQAVDLATDGVTVMSEQMKDAIWLQRLLINPETSDLLFTQGELREAMEQGYEHNSNGLDGVSGLQAILVTFYNVIIDIITARTLKGADKAVQKRIADANEAVDKAAEQKKYSEENKYIGLISFHETLKENEMYQALSDEEQEAYLEKRISEMKAEEEADPSAFARKYGFEPFWLKSGWATRIRRRMEDRNGVKQ